MATAALAPVYSTKDFTALRARLVALIQFVFPTWQNFDVVNFANILFEMFCLVGDSLSFVQNNAAPESRIVTAGQRRNLLALAKLFNYTPALDQAATTDVTLTFTGLTADVEIPAGQVIRTQAVRPIEFQLLEPLTATSAAPTVSGSAEHSVTETQIYQATGQGGQALPLDDTPFIGLVSVVGASSGTWTQIPSLLLAGSGDRVFTVDVDNTDKATLSFGDGKTGAMPSDVLTVTYKTGGGAAGNVAANTLTKIDPLQDVEGNPVSVTVTNPDSASGGIDRETSDSIKVGAPRSIQAPTCSIGRADFETNALSLVKGLTHALMLTTNEDPSIGNNSGRLYLVPAGDESTPPAPGVLSTDLISRVTDVFFAAPGVLRAPRPAPLSFSLSVLSTTYLDFAVVAKIALTKAVASPAPPALAADTRHALFVAVQQALEDYFSPVLADGTPNPGIDYGFYLRAASSDPNAEAGQIPISEIMKAVLEVDGVRTVGADPLDFVVSTRTVDPSGLVTPIESGVHHDVNLEDTWFPRFLSLELFDEFGIPVI
jgi:hypothetical protein